MKKLSNSMAKEQRYYPRTEAEQDRNEVITASKRYRPSSGRGPSVGEAEKS